MRARAWCGAVFAFCMLGLAAGHSMTGSEPETEEGLQARPIPAAVLSQVPADAEVFWTGDGKRIGCFLPYDVMIQGVLCRGGRHRDWETVFYPDGKLYLAWLAKDQRIQDIPCMKATFLGELLRRGTAGVRFHPNGRVARCRVSEACVIRGHAFKRGEMVYLDPNGVPVTPGNQ